MGKVSNPRVILAHGDQTATVLFLIFLGTFKTLIILSLFLLRLVPPTSTNAFLSWATTYALTRKAHTCPIC